MSALGSICVWVIGGDGREGQAQSPVCAAMRSRFAMPSCLQKVSPLQYDGEPTGRKYLKKIL
jgi:hypothetical protein